MKARAHPSITRSRIEQLRDRTIETSIPPLEKLFRPIPKDAETEMAREMIEKMMFSSYIGAKTNGTLAMSALLVNSNNLDELKRNGGLGAVIEILRKTDFVKQREETFNLMKCLRTLCLDSSGDKSSQLKLLSHPHGVDTILKLCKNTSGPVQGIAAELLMLLSKLEGGISTLVDHNVLGILMSEEMLYRSSTTEEVRHSSSNLVHRIAISLPERFPADAFVTVALDAEGNRRINSYQEIQFLQGLILHWNKRIASGGKLNKLFGLFPHLINEIKSEMFENLDHCILLVKCCIIASRDPAHIEYMMANDLQVALQYLVSTDFSLYRKKQDAIVVGKMKGALERMKKKTKRLSVQDPGERDAPTLAALAMVKPVVSENRSKEEMNFFATKSVVTIYENILEQRVEIISEIVSSGIIPALLFRVGPGVEKDMRYLSMVVQFVHFIVMKVITTQPQDVPRIGMIPLMPKRTAYYRAGEEEAQINLRVSGRHVIDFRAHVAAMDMRSISNTLHAQGVVDLLMSTLVMSDFPKTVYQAIMSLSVMVFAVIREEACVPINMSRIVHLCSSRPEYFYPALGMLCQTIVSARHDELLLHVGIELKGLKILIHALKLSGWLFDRKALVFTCVVKLCHLNVFRSKLVEFGGMSVVLFEVKLRRALLKAQRRNRDPDRDATTNIDDSVETLFYVLREDFAAAKIQSIARRNRDKARVAIVRQRRENKDGRDGSGSSHGYGQGRTSTRS